MGKTRFAQGLSLQPDYVVSDAFYTHDFLKLKPFQKKNLSILSYRQTFLAIPFLNMGQPLTHKKLLDEILQHNVRDVCLPSNVCSSLWITA
jgi:hypothetical protein